jgi:predicted nucleic acid-binding protein
MVFIDTNIPMYAAGQSHPLRAACQRVIREVAAGHIEAVTDCEVFQEILYRYLKIGEQEKGFQIFDDFHRIMAGRILAVEEGDVRRARSLAEEYDVSPRDLIHLAIMRNNGIEEILTADEDFDRVKGIKRIDPTQFRIVEKQEGG